MKNFNKNIALSIICLLVISGICLKNNFLQGIKPDRVKAAVNGEKTMELTGDAFKNNDMIPRKYTCDGENISPPLKLNKIPEKTSSLALIVDDPDAPVGTFVHWVMYNIPANTTKFNEGIPDREELPDGSIQGKNDFGKIGYGGPCPPGGTHRYFFKLYALDDNLNLSPGATKQQLEKTMNGHIIEMTELIGLYKR